jgi:hypothetical protein
LAEGRENTMTHALIGGLGLFAVCWVLHVIVWRIHRPQGYLLWLPVVFVLCPLMVGVAVALIGGIDPASIVGLKFGEAAFIEAIVLHLIVTWCYTCGYAGITEYSPSAEVIQAVQEHMPEGIEPEALRVRSFTEHSLTGKRMEHLVTTRMIVIEGDEVRLTRPGRRMARMVRAYRVFLGVDPIGKG